tara:strand:- start:4238 stop:4414 length:177 start_codon:yes stop_codon:yes gene_type:complete
MSLTEQLSEWFNSSNVDEPQEFDFYFEPNDDGGSDESILDEQSELITEARWSHNERRN